MITSTDFTIFWQAFTTSTAEFIVNNYQFFASLLVSVIIITVIGGLYYGFTYIFRKGKRR